MLLGHSFLWLQNGWAPLRWATYKGHSKVVETLAQLGADVNAVSKVRMCPVLTYAALRLWIVSNSAYDAMCTCAHRTD